VSTSDHNIALYSVSVGGQKLSDELAKAVREVRVESYLRLPDMCTLVVIYKKPDEGQPPPIDDNPFEIGKSLEVKLGAPEETTTTTLFTGDIVSVEASFGAGGIELHCRGLDKSHLLIRSRQAQTFQNQSTSDIVQKIVEGAGLTASCDSTSVVHDFMMQDNETDWDFIWRLAERVGFEFVVEGSTCHFRKPTAESAVSLEWPTSLRSFSPRVTAIQQVKGVSLAVQDPKTKSALTGTARNAEQIASIGIERSKIISAFDAPDIHIATEPVKSSSEATTVAQALLNKLANGYIAADGVCVGNPKIKAGVSVNVSGIGQKFSGTYRVAAATHVLRGGGTYETRFANSPAHTLLGSVGGDRNGSVSSFGSQVVLGVVDDNSDPDEMGRVAVKLPSLGDGPPGSGGIKTTWARIASVSAGNARGVMMLPQVGEEVLVAFEHGDTTRPYVLGSLFNGVDKPGDDLTQGKDGSFAVLSDKKIVATSKEDMLLTSNGQLTIKVDKDIGVTGQGGLTETISKDVKITSQQGAITVEATSGQISVKADSGQVTVEGMGGVTLKCGASQIQITQASISVQSPQISLG
jgi:phage protein D/phage baseplate assembly protein gpV